jgi:hypothetical protein
MNYRIIKHQWQGAYISDYMYYYTIEHRQINFISVLKRLIFINKEWHEWNPVKDKREAIHFQHLQDARLCLMRLISGDSIGDWKETIVK